jgi:hypothetical protein
MGQNPDFLLGRNIRFLSGTLAMLPIEIRIEITVLGCEIGKHIYR